MYWPGGQEVNHRPLSSLASSDPFPISFPIILRVIKMYL